VDNNKKHARLSRIEVFSRSIDCIFKNKCYFLFSVISILFILLDTGLNETISRFSTTVSYVLNWISFLLIIVNALYIIYRIIRNSYEIVKGEKR
jgi:hypothetical protein